MSIKSQLSGSPIGIDIGRRQIKAVQVGGGKDRPRLLASASLGRSDEQQELCPAEFHRFCTVLNRRGFIGRRVVVAVPNQATLTGIFNLPPASSGAPLEQIARMEMARAHRVEEQHLEVAHWPLPKAARSGDTTAVMAAGCTHQTADSLLDIIEAEGLTVCGLDVEGWALARACAGLIAQESGVVAGVNLGWDSATFELLYQGIMVYQRSLDGCGTKSLIESVTKQHDLPAEVIDYLLFDVGLDGDAQSKDIDLQLLEKVRPQIETYVDTVTAELNLSMSYAQHQYPDAPVQRMLLVGGGAAIPGIDARVSGIVEGYATAVRLGDLIECAETHSDEARSTLLTIAAGLAQYPQEIAA